MKRLPMVFSTIFLISIISLVSISSSMPLAEADSEEITVTITIFKNDMPTPFTYSLTQDVTVSAFYNVEMNQRDNGRHDRFCGTTNDFFITIDNVSTTLIKDCEGKGPWDVQIVVTNTIHELSLPVTIQVNAI